MVELMVSSYRSAIGFIKKNNWNEEGSYEYEIIAEWGRRGCRDRNEWIG